MCYALRRGISNAEVFGVSRLFGFGGDKDGGGFVLKVEMDIPAIAERLYYFTSGYPFLVSKLREIIAEKLLPQKIEKRWVFEEVDRAVNLLLKENNTNLRIF